MVFGPYPSGQCFYIEKSACYQQVQNGVKMAEFWLLKEQKDDPNPTVWIVEAKSSCPRDYTAYMQEVRTKLVNAFLLGVAVCVGRHPCAMTELPQAFRDLNLAAAKFQLVLVIREAPDKALVMLQTALRNLIAPITKTWPPM
ncbi:MAG: hypothetical protein QM520_00715, partial [Gammaproteobacteria bacterium]|nr:hypothetical protein [Gammaproteobacteria bacterium]